MKAICVLTAGVLLAAVAGAADDPKDVRALIDRVFDAAGGYDKISQPRAYSFKLEMTEKSKKTPDGVVTRATFYFQPPKKFRMEKEVPRGGRASKYIEVINGNKGWAKLDGAPQPVSAQTIARPVEIQQGFGYKFILLLRDKGNTPAALGESKVGDRAVVGIKLTHPVGRGAEERRLFFDAQTFLLVKSELHAKLSTGSEIGSEQTWDDYKTIDGIAVPHRVVNVMKLREPVTVERVYSDFQFADQLDPKLFEAP